MGFQEWNKNGPQTKQSDQSSHSGERRRSGVLSIGLGGVYLGKVEVIVTRHVVAEKVGTHKK